MNVNAIRSIISNIDGGGTDDLILAKQNAQLLLTGYEEANVSAPDWVYDGINVLKREIDHRNKAELELRLKKLKAQREGLSTIAEKRKSADDEIERLQKALNA